MSAYCDLDGTNIFLIGMMGSGKTTVGKELAPPIGYRFVDTDALITACTGKTISELFTDRGEIAFRQLETRILQEVSTYTRLVVATGGGIVLANENWSYLHHGIVIWLDVPVPILWERLRNDPDRPLLQTADPFQTIEILVKQRADRYAQADLHIAAGSDPAVVCQRIFMELTDRVKPNRLKLATQYPDENTCPQNGNDRWHDKPCPTPPEA